MSSIASITDSQLILQQAEQQQTLGQSINAQSNALNQAGSAFAAMMQAMPPLT